MEDEILFTRENTDSIVFSIVKQFEERSKIGKEKYGTDMDRDDLTLNEWLQHAQEEHMDAILYLEKIKKIVDGKIIIEKSDSETVDIVYKNTVNKELKRLLYAYIAISIIMLIYNVYNPIK